MMPFNLLAAVGTFIALVGFLVARHRRRQQIAASRKHPSQFTAGADNEGSTQPDIPDDIRRSFTFWGGALSGVFSAAVTHWLDVLKILRHVGKPFPQTCSGFFVGLPMGSFAQGERFAATLVLNMTLQKRLDIWEKRVARKNGRTKRLTSFLLSMVAAGIGEFLANPPVVIKNYQITHNVSCIHAVGELWGEGGVSRFFNGVVMGVARKSLANAIVLQSVGPMQKVISSSLPLMFVGDGMQKKALMGFLAGSITGSLAEVLTNLLDEVKTMTQTEDVLLWQAVATALQHPFRGALWAGIRKGLIRGLNWGGLMLCMAFFERLYLAKQRAQHLLELCQAGDPRAVEVRDAEAGLKSRVVGG